MVEVSVNFQNPPPSVDLGAFTLMIRHHPSLTLQSASMGNTLENCEWEHFSYSQLSDNRVEIFSVGDIANGPNHPSCEATISGKLAKLTFTVSATLPYEEHFLPVEWIWFDCGDNSMSSVNGSSLFISDDVYEFDGTTYEEITGSSPFPTLRGAPSQCGGATRNPDFYCGGVHAWGIDTIPPVAICPDDITVDNDPGQCSAVVTFEASVTDNRPGATISCSPASGSTFDVGQTEVLCIAGDIAGLADTCSFVVTVKDAEYPIFACPVDILAFTNPGDSGAIVHFDFPFGDDNCPGYTVETFPPSGSFFEIGTTQIAAIITDIAGNYNGCLFDVTVAEGLPPTAECPTDTVIENDPGECGANIDFGGASSSRGHFFSIGTTSVELVAVDSLDQEDTCRFDVTIIDAEPPVASCPVDIEMLNDSGEYGATVTFEVEVTDNCAGAAVVADPPSGSLFPIGITEVEVIAADMAWHEDTCYFTVTVLMNDPDEDGWPSWDDNCPDVANPDQEDLDGDGWGDVCDECHDSDLDGYGDPGYPEDNCPLDNCPDNFNPSQRDLNNDGTGDACCCLPPTVG
ncbi:MAG: hypothetical protein DRP45_12355, partial [Candidatus Zixiibacteriota bacterium]